MSTKTKNPPAPKAAKPKKIAGTAVESFESKADRKKREAKEADKQEYLTFTIEETKKPQKEIIAERVTFEKVGAKFDKDTTLPEMLVILDFFGKTRENIEFYIGDAINFADKTFGDKFTWAMEKTGRSISTLRQYARVAKALPTKVRVPELGFAHHLVVTTVANDVERIPEASDRLAKVTELLDLAKGDNGHAKLTTRELTEEVQKISPPVSKPGAKKRGPKKKAKKTKIESAETTAAPEPVPEPIPVYELTDEEVFDVNIIEQNAEKITELLTATDYDNVALSNKILRIQPEGRRALLVKLGAIQDFITELQAGLVDYINSTFD